MNNIREFPLHANKNDSTIDTDAHTLCTMKSKEQPPIKSTESAEHYLEPLAKNDIPQGIYLFHLVGVCFRAPNQYFGLSTAEM